MQLDEQHCQTSIPPQLLSIEQLNNYLKEVPQWTINSDHKSISRDFRFTDYPQTLKFINAIAGIINNENHHPEISFGYNHCTVCYSTHSAGGVTLFDFICAAHINRLALTPGFCL